ncbi:MAG TPA: hypothetical protein PLP29_10575 [Candidatus Ozemobacteraceae bacterium]|nr:hypothetical protein [Candidatus Ozemobacteraceae bacterium]
MKKLVLVAGLAAVLVGGVPLSAMAAKPPVEAKVKAEAVEKTGVVEVKPADQAKKEKYNTVTLKVGNDTFKLIPGKGNKTIMADIEKLAGKEVTVKGDLLPADDKHPMAAIRLQSFAEKAAAPAAAPAPADAATPAPSAEPAAAPAPADAAAPAPAAEPAAAPAAGN